MYIFSVIPLLRRVLNHRPIGVFCCVVFGGINPAAAEDVRIEHWLMPQLGAGYKCE